MKFKFITTFLTGLLFIGCSDEQRNNNSVATSQHNEFMDNFQYTFKSAHPNAQALMTEEFYWSPIEETAPFGSDDGSDAAYGFRQWRPSNKVASPVTFLKELIARWQYPFFDYNEMDTIKIKKYLSHKKKELSETEIQQQIKTLKELNKDLADGIINKLDKRQLREFITSSSKGMGHIYLLGQDNAIIGIGFAQLVLEGYIDNDIKGLTVTAITRQLLPLFIDRYDSNYRYIRKDQLTKMLEVVNKSSFRIHGN